MANVESHKSGGIGKDIGVYVCLLALAGLQFIIAYQNMDASRMLSRMLIVACAEALLAVLFFMHLWAEKEAFCCLWPCSRFLFCWRCNMDGPTVFAWRWARRFPVIPSSTQEEG